MPVIGAAFSCGTDGRRFVKLELFRGLAQRNNGRKTSYFDGSPVPEFLSTLTAPGLIEINHNSRPGWLGSGSELGRISPRGISPPML
jgi:hypothetical protein